MSTAVIIQTVMADAETEPVAAEEVPAQQPAEEAAPEGEAAEAEAPATAEAAEADENGAETATAEPEAAAPAAVVPADAALKAAEIAARIAAEHGPGSGQAYPVSSGADHAAADDSNKRKLEDTADPNDPNKRPYVEGQYQVCLADSIVSCWMSELRFQLVTYLLSGIVQEGNPGPGGVLPPIAAAPGVQSEYGSADASELIQCPPSFVGKVIGKGGETIRDLQNRSGARIQVDHNAEEGKPRAITITGHASAVAAAKKLVEDIIASGDNPSTVPASAICSVHVCTLFSGVCCVALHFSNLLLSLIAAAGAAGDVQQSVNCPPGIVGRVIGRGGETIRALQSASGAHISIDQNFPEGMDRQVHVQGNAEAVERGVKMVTELIAGGPGSANDAIQKVIQKVGSIPHNLPGLCNRPKSSCPTLFLVTLSKLNSCYVGYPVCSMEAVLPKLFNARSRWSVV